MMSTAFLMFDDTAIPAELKAIPHWVCWRAVPNEDRIEKIPVCTATGNNASSTDPRTWTDYTSAAKAASTQDGLGLGFVFQQNAGIVGVDLDKCRDPETGALEPWAEEIVNSLNTYGEVSPSGRGLHLYMCGTLPPGRRKKGNVEVYEHGRFFTVTGHHLAGTPTTIANLTGELAAFHARYLANPAPERPASTMTRAATLGDVEIIEKCRAAKNAPKFEGLWQGDASGYASQSDADLAMIGMLKFYTQDAGQLDRLFRQSRLMRAKWDERRGDQTYGERTIAEALAHVRETYTAHKGPMGSVSNVAQYAVGEPEARQQVPDLSQALVTYTDLLALEIPERPRYLPWLLERSNVMVFGPRGIGKTFFQLALAVALTTGKPLWKWACPKPVGVLYVDGEMPLDELRQRTTDLMETPPTASLEFLTSQLVYQRCGKDLVLTSDAMRQEIVKILDARPEICVMILDNISCLFSGLNEDSKQDWEPNNAWLIRLRHRGITTILVHHAGKGGQQRGTSGREDSLDTVIQLAKPTGGDARDGCHFELSFTKCRSVTGEAVAPLDVKLQTVNERLQWEWKLLEVSTLDRARQLFTEGVSSPTELSEELGINKGYASRILKKLRAEVTA